MGRHSKAMERVPLIVDGNMSQRRRKAQGTRRAAAKSSVATIKPKSTASADGPIDIAVRYAEACGLAAQGKRVEARRIYAELDAVLAGHESEARLRALVCNDLAAIAALEGRFDQALAGWRAALEVDPDCLMARLNWDLIEAELSMGPMGGDVGELRFASVPSPLVGEGGPQGRMGGAGTSDGGSGLPGFVAPHLPFGHPLPGGEEIGASGRREGSDGRVRVAILSFLFNWPSTGGGNHHTAELAKFLAQAGYEVKHFFAQYPGWGMGKIADTLISPSEAIAFDETNWNAPAIQARFRQAVDAFAPDYVMITDAWNMKPYLAEAVRGYAYYLLYQAQENICPLNNLRLLATGPTTVEQCPRNQLATPEVCCRCLAERGRHSGALHRAERELAGVGTREYYAVLRQSLAQAEAVLVLNPVIAALVEPYCSRVTIVPWGMDKMRFPWPVRDGTRECETALGETAPSATRLFMAAVAGETIKGFHVAHEACRILRKERTDFELVVTFDPPGTIDEFTRSVGWCSLDDLPRHYRQADICLVPTIAQDSLSRTSVEAMASGIPVIASRIGGLPYTVTDGVTGFLFEPGDPADLARKIGQLLDDPELRRRMGLAGRKRFEDDFVWEDVIERYFRPLLTQHYSQVK
jgi:glycosyltransferase involved in cell wall biosynthesis